MFKKFTKTDTILIFTAIICLISSEYLWFTGEKNAALFVGLWAPTILCFGIYFRLIQK
jgi:hypothetical protein